MGDLKDHSFDSIDNGDPWDGKGCQNKVMESQLSQAGPPLMWDDKKVEKESWPT